MTELAEDAEIVRRVAAGQERADAERAFCQRYAARASAAQRTEHRLGSIRIEAEEPLVRRSFVRMAPA